MGNPVVEQYISGKLNLEGTNGHLTEHQKDLLRQLWVKLLAAFDKNIEELGHSEPIIDPSEKDSDENIEDHAKDGGNMKSSKSEPATNTSALTNGFSLFGFGKKKVEHHDIHYKQLVRHMASKESVPPPFNEKLTNHTVRDAFWDSIMCDNPDYLMLRFLRARKWNVNDGYNMIMNCLSWRTTENITKIQWYGESLINLRLIKKGLGFLHGVDRIGQPVFYIPAHTHFGKDQPIEHFVRYIIYLIEMARLSLVHPAEKACIFFDLQHISMANVDWKGFRAFLKVLTDYYPECLGILIVYKANSIFSLLWKAVKGMLDPVVASKVNFVNSKQELLKFISEDQLLSEYEGKCDYHYEYVMPRPGENDRMYDAEEICRLKTERIKSIEELETATREWSDPNISKEKVEEAKKKRDETIEKFIGISKSYRDHVHARTIYHRLGLVNN